MLIIWYSTISVTWINTNKYRFIVSVLFKNLSMRTFPVIFSSVALLRYRSMRSLVAGALYTTWFNMNTTPRSQSAGNFFVRFTIFYFSKLNKFFIITSDNVSNFCFDILYSGQVGFSRAKLIILYENRKKLMYVSKNEKFAGPTDEYVSVIIDICKWLWVT